MIYFQIFNGFQCFRFQNNKIDFLDENFFKPKASNKILFIVLSSQKLHFNVKCLPSLHSFIISCLAHDLILESSFM